jgi:hypothetical protein
MNLLNTACISLLLTLCCAQTVGQAVVLNSCNQSIWYTSVSNVAPPVAELLPGLIYRETFRIYPGGNGGISIKLGYDQDLTTILQFEYTYVPSSYEVWYDLSNLNGDPFVDDGFVLEGSSSDCKSITCAPGEEICYDAYTYPTESGVVFVCGSSNTLTLTICSASSNTTVTMSAASSTTTSTATTAMSTVPCTA